MFSWNELSLSVEVCTPCCWQTDEMWFSLSIETLHEIVCLSSSTLHIKSQHLDEEEKVWFSENFHSWGFFIHSPPCDAPDDGEILGNDGFSLGKGKEVFLPYISLSLYVICALSPAKQQHIQQYCTWKMSRWNHHGSLQLTCVHGGTLHPSKHAGSYIHHFLSATHIFLSNHAHVSLQTDLFANSNLRWQGWDENKIALFQLATEPHLNSVTHVT